MRKTIIFDFDGTLLYTDKIVTDSFKYMFAYYNFPPVSEQRIRQTFGGLMIDEIVALKNEFKINADPEEMLKVYRSYHHEHFEEKIELFNGVKELLESLKKGGYELCLLTSRKKTSTYQGLKHFDIEKYFSLIVTADDTPFIKPDKRAALSILEKIGKSKNDAVLIGDSHFDIGCANNAEIVGVLAVWGREFSQKEIDNIGAKFVAKTPLEIINILEKL